MGSGGWRMNGVDQKEEEVRKGPWSQEEDNQLVTYVRIYGPARWSSLAKLAGLNRDGKSCRMRWLNYLRPDIKHGTFTPHENRLIIELHNKWGNRWSWIAKSLPGRTDNEIKNHWRTHIKKMAPEITGSCSWPPASKSKAGIKAARQKIKPSCSKNVGHRQMAAMEESTTRMDTPKNVSSANLEFQDVYEIHEEFIKESCVMDTQGDIIAHAHVADMVQYSPTYSWSSGADCPMNVLSDSEEFLWDYNSIDLWNLDDNVQNMSIK